VIVTVAIVKSAENLSTLEEGRTSNLFVDENGRLHVAPTGGRLGRDASAAKQDEQTVYLDAISNKIPPLGTTEMTASMPVTLATEDAVASNIATTNALSRSAEII
jgi:hypothetical protein